jgi:RNA polymerase sigma factor (sigma-70 family)
MNRVDWMSWIVGGNEGLGNLNKKEYSLVIKKCVRLTLLSAIYIVYIIYTLLAQMIKTRVKEIKMIWPPVEVNQLEAAMLGERTRLIHLCARLTGDKDAAEDLAQETLLEAWRNRHKLYNLRGKSQWFSAIARNVCLRWARSRSRQLPQLMLSTPDEDDSSNDLQEWLADDYDLTIELEYRELAELLNQALAYLPTVTRQVLVERYIRGASYAEIAASLGTSEGAVAMRLNRSKLLLRRLLTEEFRYEASVQRPGEAMLTNWEETRIWCPTCGKQRMLGYFGWPGGTLSFRCPQCNPTPDINHSDVNLANSYFAQLLAGIKQYKTAFNRTLVWANNYYRQGLKHRIVTCTHCGHLNQLQLCMPRQATPLVRNQPGVHVECVRCREICSSSLAGLVMSLPQVRQFWRENLRMRTLPETEIQIAGRVGLVTSFEAVTTSARLDVISDSDTYEVINIQAVPTLDRV